MTRRRGNNEGSISPRSNGTWRAQVTLQGRRLSFTAKTRRDCQEWIRQTQGQVDNGMTFAGYRQCLADYLADWMKVQKTVFRPSTWSHYSQLLRMYILPMIGDCNLRNVRTEYIQRLYNHLIDQKVGIPTIRKIHKLLRSAFEQAVASSVISNNPIAHTRPPKEPETEIHVWSEDQVSTFFAAISDHKWEALFSLAVVTGARRGELLGLQWENLDWVKHIIRIDKQLSKTPNNGPMFQPLKTKSSKRTIDLGETTIQILRKHYEHQRLQRIAADERWIEHGLIFSNSKGGPICASHMTRIFKDIAMASGLPLIKFHALRHTNATTLLAKGIPTLIVSKRLGHSRPSTTLNVYAHMVDGMGSEAAKAMDELVPTKLHSNCTHLHTPSQNATKIDDNIPDVAYNINICPK
jgi:integrase